VQVPSVGPATFALPLRSLTAQGGNGEVGANFGQNKGKDGAHETLYSQPNLMLGRPKWRGNKGAAIDLNL
jgi:hypothetical protein